MVCKNSDLDWWTAERGDNRTRLARLFILWDSSRDAASHWVMEVWVTKLISVKFFKKIMKPAFLPKVPLQTHSYGLFRNKGLSSKSTGSSALSLKVTKPTNAVFSDFWLLVVESTWLRKNRVGAELISSHPVSRRKTGEHFFRNISKRTPFETWRLKPFRNIS